MTNIADKLRLIMEGNLLLEAPEDKYDIDSAPDDNQPDQDNQNNTPQTTDDEGTGADDNTNPDDTEGSDYGLEDDSADDTPSSNGADGDNISDNAGVISTPEPAVGEVLNISPKTRAILAFKNFEHYRDLRDDTSRLITELSEFVPTNDEVRAATNITIEKSTDLLNKLNDYILYKYSETSYELNYYNFMQFILEKRYLNELYDNIIKSSSQSKSNK